MLYGYSVRVLWIPLFSFCHSYLDLSHDFHAQLCFHLAVEMSDKQAFRSQTRQIAVTDPIGSVLLHLLFQKYAKKML